jgi:hypothetical protein
MKLRISTCWLSMALSFAAASAQARHIDLGQWEYSPPQKSPYIGGPGEYGSNPHLLSFFSNGDLVIGFVTQKSERLATREHSSMTLHALTFSDGGEFRSERKFQATDWYDNDLFAGEGSDLLVRIGTDLNLYAPDGKILANRELQDRDAQVKALPNRQAFVVESVRVHPHQYIFTVLDSHTLDLMSTCYRSSRWMFQSISTHNMLVYSMVYDTVSPNQIEVGRFCDPLQFKYEWRNEKGAHSYDATLVDDNHFVLAGVGSSSIEFFDRGVREWKDSFNRKHDQIVPQIAVDNNGDTFAVLVKTSVGGSNFFDINGHLKGERIIVYNSASGKRLAEVPIEKLSPDVFNFQLSPNGKLLAILSDGDLELYPIDTH